MRDSEYCVRLGNVDIFSCMKSTAERSTTRLDVDNLYKDGSTLYMLRGDEISVTKSLYGS